MSMARLYARAMVKIPMASGQCRTRPCRTMAANTRWQMLGSASVFLPKACRQGAQGAGEEMGKVRRGSIGNRGAKGEKEAETAEGAEGASVAEGAGE